jgi:4-hydroxyphenylacetate 3-monooxygenase
MKDGRVVYYGGEPVKDIATHPILGRCVQNRAREYDLHHDPRFSEALSYVAENGKRRCIGYQIPRSMEDLKARRKALQVCLKRAGGGVSQAMHLGGVVANGPVIAAAAMTRGKWRSRLPRRFAENILAYYERCAGEDLAVQFCSNDAKGDHNRGPLEQEEPDMYTRVVKETDGGLVLRGIKKVATGAVCCDEVLIITHFGLFKEYPRLLEDRSAREALNRSYTFICSVPLNASGVKILTRPAEVSLAQSAADYPISWYDEMDTLIFLDDVFIPWERVLLYQNLDIWLEWLKEAFQTKICAFDLAICIAERMELLVGAASLAARVQGSFNAPNTKLMLAQLVAHLEATRLFIEAAERRPDAHLAAECDGLVFPSLYYSDLALNQGFNHLSQMMYTVASVLGGATPTCQSVVELSDPDLQRILSKCFARPGFQGEEVVRLARFIQDLTCSRAAMRSEMHLRFSLGASQVHQMYIANTADLTRCEEKVWGMIHGAGAADGKSPETRTATARG